MILKNICLIYLKKAGHSLRRFECGPRGDRPCQSGIKSYERRFTDDERNKMTELLSDGFTDSFRYLHQDKKMPTPGGATLQNPGKEISGGELIISSSPIYCSRGLKRQKSILPFWAVTTARWNWILKSKIYLQDSNYLYHSERRNLNDECTHRGR